MTEQHTTKEWASELQVFWERVSRVGRVPDFYTKQYQILLEKGDDCIEELIVNVLSRLQEIINELQNHKLEDQLKIPCQETLLESYFSIQILHFPFLHESRFIDPNDLEADEIQKMEDLMKNFSDAVTCLENWIADPDVTTFGDISDTPAEVKYKSAFEKISKFFDEAKKAQEGISQSMEGITNSLEKMRWTLKVSSLIENNREQLSSLRFKVLEGTRGLVDILKSTDTDPLTKKEQMISHVKGLERLMDQIGEINSSIDKVCPEYNYRDLYDESELQEYHKTRQSEAGKYTSEEDTKYSRCTFEGALWDQKKQCQDIIKTSSVWKSFV
jgi:hypothetical protein